MADADVGGVERSPAAAAALSGGISVDAADAIRRGLGRPDAGVTEDRLRDAARELVARAGAMTAEELLRAARRARAGLDADAVERGEKQRASQRYVRVWSRDGLSGGSWCLPDGDGGLEVHTAMRLLAAGKTGGPRFAETGAAKAAAAVPLDERTPEQLMADGFAQVFHNGLAADPAVVPGLGRAAVRVIVRHDALATGTGMAVLEDTMAPISHARLEEHLCGGGTLRLALNPDGSADVGREQRLFTARQRAALGARDGGCRFPGCPKPPSWTEAHHIVTFPRFPGHLISGYCPRRRSPHAEEWISAGVS
jgi:hypothetical protein